MDTRHVFVAGLVVAAALSASPTVHAQPKGYYYDDSGCLRRHWVYVGNLPSRSTECDPRKRRTNVPPPLYLTVDQEAVERAITCDIAHATHRSKGHPGDLAKAEISGTLTYSLVSKSSAGVGLTFPAIPVFIGAFQPALEASRISEQTSVATTEFSINAVDAKCLKGASASNPSWLANLVQRQSIDGFKRKKMERKLDFVVTRQGKAGLKLNIVPIAIGPQFDNTQTNSQKLHLTINYEPKKEGKKDELDTRLFPKPERLLTASSHFARQRPLR
jgi:hypothetical protein